MGSQSIVKRLQWSIASYIYSIVTIYAKSIFKLKDVFYFHSSTVL